MARRAAVRTIATHDRDDARPDRRSAGSRSRRSGRCGPHVDAERARPPAVPAVRRHRRRAARAAARRRPRQRGRGGPARTDAARATPRRRSASTDVGATTASTRVDDAPALYVYEMRDRQDRATRGLLGAVELRDPTDGVILPHENTMAGPVADRLAVMTATGSRPRADLPRLRRRRRRPRSCVRTVDDQPNRSRRRRTPDGITHRLWAVTDPDAHTSSPPTSHPPRR